MSGFATSDHKTVEAVEGTREALEAAIKNNTTELKSFNSKSGTLAGIMIAVAILQLGLMIFQICRAIWGESS